MILPPVDFLDLADLGLDDLEVLPPPLGEPGGVGGGGGGAGGTQVPKANPFSHPA